MKRLLALLLVALPVAVRADSCPVATPDGRQFHISAPLCNAAQPCVATEPVTLSLEKNTVCYPSYISCPGYEIQSCDLVTWDFGDGSEPVAVVGQKSITHLVGPGLHTVAATVSNARGTATVWHQLYVGMAPPAFVRFERDAYTVREDDGTATLRIVRTGDLERPVPVTYWVGAGAFVPMRGEIVLPPGEAGRDIVLPIVNDLARHKWDPALVFLQSETGEAIFTGGYAASVSVTVLDDDPVATVSPVLEQRTYVEGEGTTTIHVGIRLSSPQAESLRLTYGIWDVMGTAQPMADYGAGWGELELAAGETEAGFDFEIYGDRMAEPEETLVLSLGPSTDNFGVHPDFPEWPVTITIVDDDDPSAPAEARFHPEALTLKAGERFWPWLATRAAGETRTLRLTSSNPDVVYLYGDTTILGGSQVTRFPLNAVSPGTSTVTATLPDGLSAALVVTVHPSGGPPLPDIYLSPGFLDMTKGETRRLTLHAGNATNEPRTVTLTPSNPAMIGVPATVTIPAGADTVAFDVLPLQGGYSTISAKLPDGRSTLVAASITLPPMPRRRRMSH